MQLFAIAEVVPWTTADAARQNTYDESRAIVQAYWSASGLPGPARDRVQNELRGYVGPADLEACIRGLEAAVVEAAFDPAALTGIRSTPVPA